MLRAIADIQSSTTIRYIFLKKCDFDSILQLVSIKEEFGDKLKVSRKNPWTQVTILRSLLSLPIILASKNQRMLK